MPSPDDTVDKRRFLHDLPPRSHITLGEAATYALYEVWMDGSNTDTVELFELEEHAGPRGLLTGIRDTKARHQREEDFLRDLKYAVLDEKVRMMGCRTDKIGNTALSSGISKREPIASHDFNTSQYLDWESDRVAYDQADMRPAQMGDFDARVLVGGSAAGLVEWEDVIVERAGFLAWLASLFPNEPNSLALFSSPASTAQTGQQNTQVITEASKPKVRSNRRDYREKDAHHFPSMQKLLADQTATSYKDAAERVVSLDPKAILGGGNKDSKIARLAKHFREAQQADSSGQG